MTHNVIYYTKCERIFHPDENDGLQTFVLPYSACLQRLCCGSWRPREMSIIMSTRYWRKSGRMPSKRTQVREPLSLKFAFDGYLFSRLVKCLQVSTNLILGSGYGQMSALFCHMCRYTWKGSSQYFSGSLSNLYRDPLLQKAVLNENRQKTLAPLK
jgi:hypothetical protein